MKKVWLLKRSTWRCGKLERKVLAYLMKIKKPVSMDTVLSALSKGTPKGRNGVREAINRLAKRMYITVTPA